MISLRPDQQAIVDLVPPGSRVLDLGCGAGEMLAWLAEERDCRGTGVEIDPDAVLQAITRGVAVIELDMDEQLVEFADRSYDVVVMSRTLQAVRRPDLVLEQIHRIGRSAVVSMPNFGYWPHRVRLLRGRMPISKDLPHAWHNTPNLHHSTLVELEDLFQEKGFSVRQQIPLTSTGAPSRIPSRLSNVLAGAAIYALDAV
ncbi:methionine biosynthesis protein MetW [Parenemella sanctibonifatiensis]|uniref:Methionine biosynthesis protein MetW n=1 Tax=Parenemella sanctibonifatiensis TaxID=2016505 RepID=A0A255EIM7_9ACTN|nr:methionine biosynthesis protein MetW [Parenemella sanctibonifatiensis]OYN86463.1 methionine biosynthesis protein MetW [Parenemella sanctibonifatiensis]OYN91100.1 methionine biosynthesis protein MetW [Parenemella sanctibonifatiensis]